MSKPRNKTNRRRLHYFGVLAAAGLLTVGAGSTAWAGNYGGGINSITDLSQSSDPTEAANITSNANAVTWNLDVTLDGGIDTVGSMDFSADNTVTTVSTNPTEFSGTITGDLTATNAEGTLYISSGHDITVGGDIITTGANGHLFIDVRNGAAFSQNTTSIVEGNVRVRNDSNNVANGLILGLLQNVDLEVTGKITASGIGPVGSSVDRNRLTGGGTVFVNAANIDDMSWTDVYDATLSLTGSGTVGGAINLDSTTGGDSILDASESTGDIIVVDLDIDGIGEHDIKVIAGSNTLTIESIIGTDIFAAGSAYDDGRVVFDASAGGEIVLDDGFSIVKDYTGNYVSAADFLGDITINSSGSNLLGVNELNISEGTYTVNGMTLILADDGAAPPAAATTVNVNGNVVFDFTNVADGSGDYAGLGFGISDGAGGISNQAGVKILNLGADGKAASVSFDSTVPNGGYFAANEMNVIGITVFETQVTLDNTFTNESNTIGDGIYVTGKLDVGNQATFKDTGNDLIITADSPDIVFTNTDNYNGGVAISMQGGAEAQIAAGTIFDVDHTNTTPDTVRFVVIDDDSEWANLSYKDGNGFDTNDNSHFYDITNGYYTYYSKTAVANAVGGAPRFARSYINSVFDFNTALAGSLSDASNQELTLAMGNTLNAALMMINNPLDGIFRNNNNLHPQTENRLARSAGDCENFGLWITPNFSFRSVDGDYSQGYGDFDVKSYGVTIGFDGWINEQFRLGLFAGINSSELDGDFQKIEGDDFQLGAYGQAFLPEGFRLNVGVAYIWQDFDARRDFGVVGEPNSRQRIKSDFDGNTLVAALELNKTFDLQNDMFLRPGIGYTYMGTELDSYRERSNAINSSWDISQRVSETDFDLHLIRVGTDLGWTAENASIIGRAYYVGNAGDNQPNTRARFVHHPTAPGFSVFGAEYDDHMANLGLSLKVAPSENTHFAIDYDALLGSDTTTHNVNLTFKYEW